MKMAISRGLGYTGRLKACNSIAQGETLGNGDREIRTL
jgi:hypothetical protein